MRFLNKRQRRLYLSELLKHQLTILRETPGLLMVKISHIVQLMGLVKYELLWLFRHQANIPQKKQEKEALGSGLQRDEVTVEMIHSLVDMRRLIVDNKEMILDYFLKYVMGFDVPEALEVLRDEVGKVNDTSIDTHPMQIMTKTLDNVMDEIKPREEQGLLAWEGNALNVL